MYPFKSAKSCSDFVDSGQYRLVLNQGKGIIMQYDFDILNKDAS